MENETKVLSEEDYEAEKNEKNEVFSKATSTIENSIKELKSKKDKYIDSISDESRVKDAEEDGDRIFTEAILFLENMERKSNSNAVKSVFTKLLKKTGLSKVTEEAKRTIIEESSLKDTIKKLSSNMDAEIERLSEGLLDLNTDLDDIEDEMILLIKLDDETKNQIQILTEDGEKKHRREIHVLGKSLRDINAIIYLNKTSQESKMKNIAAAKALISEYERNGGALIKELVKNLKNATDRQKNERIIKQLVLLRELTNVSMVTNKKNENEMLLQTSNITETDFLDGDSVKKMNELDLKFESDMKKKFVDIKSSNKKLEVAMEVAQKNRSEASQLSYKSISTDDENIQ